MAFPLTLVSLGFHPGLLMCICLHTKVNFSDLGLQAVLKVYNVSST